MNIAFSPCDRAAMQAPAGSARALLDNAEQTRLPAAASQLTMAGGILLHALPNTRKAP